MGTNTTRYHCRCWLIYLTLLWPLRNSFFNELTDLEWQNIIKDKIQNEHNSTQHQYKKNMKLQRTPEGYDIHDLFEDLFYFFASVHLKWTRTDCWDEKSAASQDVVDLWLAHGMMEPELKFREAATNCVTWHCRVFLCNAADGSQVTFSVVFCPWALRAETLWIFY